jgi:hypothetical protein
MSWPEVVQSVVNWVGVVGLFFIFFKFITVLLNSK